MDLRGLSVSKGEVASRRKEDRREGKDRGASSRGERDFRREHHSSHSHTPTTNRTSTSSTTNSCNSNSNSRDHHHSRERHEDRRERRERKERERKEHQRRELQHEFQQTTSVNHDLRHFRDSRGRTLVHQSSKKGDLKLTKHLVERAFCDVNAVDHSGRTPLCVAIFYKRFDIVQYLLQKHELDTSVEDSDGNGVLHWFARLQTDRSKSPLPSSEFHRLLCLAVDQGCSFYRRNKNGENPAHLAAACGNQSIISYAMYRHVQPSVRDRYGETPLHAAVRAGNIVGVQLLLNQGCHRFVSNNKGVMACELLLDDAVTQKLPPVVVAKMKKLLVCSPLLSRARERPERFSTPSMGSSTFPPCSPQESLSLLSTIGEIDAEEMTLVHYAAAQGNLDLLEHLLTLLTLTPVWSHKNIDGSTPLQLLCYKSPYPEDEDVYSRLLSVVTQKMVDVLCTNHRGENALHLAVLANNKAAVRSLVRMGFPVDSPSLYGETTLHAAIISGSTSMAKLLLGLGADPTILSHRPKSNAETPMDLAMKTGQTSLISLFYCTGLSLNLRRPFLNDPDVNGVGGISEDLAALSMDPHLAVSPRTSTNEEGDKAAPSLSSAASYNELSTNNGSSSVTINRSSSWGGSSNSTSSPLASLSSQSGSFPSSLSGLQPYVGVSPRVSPVASPVASPVISPVASPVLSPSLPSSLPLAGEFLSSPSSSFTSMGAHNNDCSFSTSSNLSSYSEKSMSVDTYTSSSDGSSSSTSLSFVSSSCASPSTVALSSGSSQCFLSSFPSTAPHSLTSKMAPANTMHQRRPKSKDESKLLSKYKIENEIARSPTTIVNRATSRQNQEKFCVKTMNLPKKTYHNLKGISVLRKITHPNLVRYTEFFFKGRSKMYMVTEFAETSVASIRKLCPFSERVLSHVGRSVAKGLLALHQHRIIHGNVKMENVLVRGETDIVLTGYALERDYSHMMKGSFRAVGTAMYLSPEAISSKWERTKDGDVWSFGVLLYALAEGEPPHSKEGSMASALQKIMNESAPLLKPGGWSIGMCELVQFCCEKNPNARGSMEEVLRHLFLKSHLKSGPSDFQQIVQEYLSGDLLNSGKTRNPLCYFFDLEDRKDKIGEEIPRLKATQVPTSIPPSPSSPSSSSSSSPSSRRSSSRTTKEGGSSKKCWTLWVAAPGLDCSPIGDISPMINFHSLKRKIQEHEDFAPLFRGVKLSRLSLLDREGKALPPSSVLSSMILDKSEISVVVR